MTRIAWLMPLSLGLLLACEGSGPTSPDANADLAVSEVMAEAELVIDVQPLGDFEKAAINTTAGQPVTVAVVDYPGSFFEDIVLSSVTFYGAAPLHVDQIEQNELCHMTTVLLPDGTTYDAHLFHFDLSGVADGVWEMCLTGTFNDAELTPFSACVEVTVQSKGGNGK